MIGVPAIINQRRVAIVAMIFVATALFWLSWRVGSPLMTEIRTVTSNVGNHGLRALAPRGGPVQRMP